jgi:hypothetical protein
MPSGGAVAESGDRWLAPVEVMDEQRVTLGDARDHFCGPAHCGFVVGNVVAYVDGSLLSITYSRTLAPFLREEITSV